MKANTLYRIHLVKEESKAKTFNNDTLSKVLHYYGGMVKVAKCSKASFEPILESH